MRMLQFCANLNLTIQQTMQMATMGKETKHARLQINACSTLSR